MRAPGDSGASFPVQDANCWIANIETAPETRCGTQGMVPCYECGEGCRYHLRAWQLYRASVNDRWWDGQPRDDPWDPAEAPLVASDDSPAHASNGKDRDPLVGLNPDQRVAAAHVDGPMVVTAGAGSGKTTALTARIAHLIAQGVPASSILAITFTRKAAQEMRERVVEAVGEEKGKHVKLRTFHALCLEIARSDYLVVNRRRGFSVWDDGVMRQQIRLLAREARDERDPALPKQRHREYDPMELLGYLNEHKEKSGSFPSDSLRAKVELAFSPYGQEAWGILEDYEKSKVLSNALDFGDLVWAVVQGAKSRDDIRARLGQRWQYVMVDEYQDTNRVQVDLLNLLAPHGNLFVVGDDDQAIYGWRGAQVAYILKFERHYPGAKTVHLGQNYRCTPPIVDSAASVISNNDERREKKLWSERDGQEPVPVIQYFDLYRESEGIASVAAKKIEKGQSPSSFAVLVRTRRQLHFLSTAFAKEGVPTRVVGITEWWQREDARLITAWLRSTLNRRDLDAGAYLLQRWPRIGMTRVKRWHDYASDEDGDMLGNPVKLLYIMRGMGEHTKAGQSLKKLEALASDMKEACRSRQTMEELVTYLYDRCGIDEDIYQASNSTVPSSVEDAGIRELHRDTFLKVARDIEDTGYAGIEELLDRVVTSSKAEDAPIDCVTLSTIHGSKGLEWDSVVVAGCVNGLLPLGHFNHQGSVQVDAPALEEERRLMYVAMTRAKNHLTLTAPMRMKTRSGEIFLTTMSSFISEAKESQWLLTR